MTILRRVRDGLRRAGYLIRATAWAALLGLIEMVGSERGRRVFAALVLIGALGGAVYSRPVRSIAPGEVGVRYNRLTGGLTELREGYVLLVPGLHGLYRFPLRDQIYRPLRSASSGGAAPFQSVEGLSLGVDVAVRYALDPERITVAARHLPEHLGPELVEPVVDGVLHRTFARHTVREIFSTQRAQIQETVEGELRPLLARDGVLVRSVFLGSVDLPAEYKAGIESLLSEELSAEKMRYTLELKEKKVRESGLEAEAEKVKRERAAEAAGLEEIIAARSRAEAMKHVLPFKEKEIEQKRLEAEAQKVVRLKGAEADADARRIEAQAEADARRKLADSDAYRLEVTGKAQSEQLARDSQLIAKNPLLIQKTLADKLSDKIQVIVAPPQAGGFFAGGLLGQSAADRAAAARAAAEAPKVTAASASAAAPAGEE
jgi:regulator of protease activity HflC (stomatin/prohibitin superfamily)